MIKSNIPLSKLSVVFSLIVITIVCYGLFINSTPSNPKSDQETGQYLYKPAPIPETASFAGEALPLENFDTRESLDRELLVNSNFHSQTLMYLKKAPRYFSIIEPILKANEIPDDFKYLALAESGFQEKIVSPAGAVGLWQFIKSAAIEQSLEVNQEVDERYHIEKSTEAACRYLKNSFQKYGKWTMVAASYNAGISGISRQTEIQDSENYYDLLLNEETSRYLFRIVALKLIMEEPLKYGFFVEETDKYPLLKSKEVTISGKVISFVEYANNHGINYKIFKLFNPWLRQPSLKNTSNKTYSVKIPDTGFRTEGK